VWKSKNNRLEVSTTPFEITHTKLICFYSCTTKASADSLQSPVRKNFRWLFTSPPSRFWNTSYLRSSSFGNRGPLSQWVRV